jgi:hypothetical protein
MSISAALHRIRVFARFRRYQPATLARLAGLHGNALRKMNDTSWNPWASTIEAVEKLIPEDFDVAAAEREIARRAEDLAGPAGEGTAEREQLSA